MARLAVDREQLTAFVDAMFRYADEGTFASLRAFLDLEEAPPVEISGVKLNGDPAQLAKAAVRVAQRAADFGKAVVFAPPVATFSNAKKAREIDLKNGLALSVECDARPEAARQLLEGLLGKATLVVASGGTWIDPATGEVQDKLHLHWRLSEPTREPEDHQRLKRARCLAALLAESDSSAVPAVHPLRWAGSWHRKHEPRLARIVDGDPACEIHLKDALDALEVAANMRDVPLDDQPGKKRQDAGVASDADLTALAQTIPNDASTDWARWNITGMAFWAASEGSDAGLKAFAEWSAKNQVYDADTTAARWKHWHTSPPTNLTVGKLVYLARQAVPDFRLPSWGAQPATSGDGAAAKGSNAPKDAWPEPAPLPSGQSPVQRFSLDLLPDRLRPWVEDVTDRMQVPPDYAAVTAMTVLGAIIGRQVGIFPKRNDNWLVVPNLWGAVIGRSGLLKTPALSEVLRPLRTLERQAKEIHAAALKEWQGRNEITREARKLRAEKIKKALKQGRSPDEILQELGDEQDERPAPIRRRFMTSDATVEKLGELLAENPNGILEFRDELSGWLRSMEREGHQMDRAFYLEAWDGKSRFTYDRISRGTVDIEAACVSVFGGIQPEPLLAYLQAHAWEGAGADGLLQRLQMVVWPDITPTWRNVDRRPDDAARERAETAFRQLVVIRQEDVGARGKGPIPALRFTDRAQDAFDAWRAKLEPRLRKGDLHPAFEAHLAKYRSLLPSLALICHLVDNGVGPIGEVAFARAEAWCDYLESHTVRLYDSIVRVDLAAARTLGEHVQAGDLPSPFQVRDVYRPCWSGLTSKTAEAAVDVLCDLGWLRAKAAKPPGGGRPTVYFTVNPAIRSAP